MFCKNCGARLEENAKFCPSCGSSQLNEAAPKPFEKNSVDGSQNYQYQTSTFSGKQASYGSSGHVNFAHTKKRSFIGRIIGLIAIAFVAMFVYYLFFDNSGPIYNLTSCTAIDSNYKPIGETSTFSTSATEIFITFSSQDIELGTDIQADWYYIDTEPSTYIDSSIISVVYEQQDAYISLTRPTGGWQIGDYEVDFFIGDEYYITVAFTIE